MRAIKRVSLSEQVLESIVKYVQEHGMQVGDKLPTEGEFSEIFQVSRTSIREAMKALGFSGAVESIPGKGTFICAPMMNSILNKSENLVFQANVSISQIMEVRTAVEVLAAELAIERGSDDEIERVADAMEDLRRAVRSQKPWGVQGSSFHVRIAEAAKNPLLVKLVDSYSDAVGRYRDAMVDCNTDSDMEQHIHDHEAILSALCARDKEAACKAVVAHMEHTETNIKRLVNDNNAITFISK